MDQHQFEGKKESASRHRDLLGISALLSVEVSIAALIFSCKARILHENQYPPFMIKTAHASTTSITGCSVPGRSRAARSIGNEFVGSQRHSIFGRSQRWPVQSIGRSLGRRNSKGSPRRGSGISQDPSRLEKR